MDWHWQSPFDRILIIALALVVLLLVVGSAAQVFEDGSFVLGRVTGCLPWALCAK